MSYTVAIVTDTTASIFKMKTQEYVSVDGSVEAHRVGRKLSCQQNKPVMVYEQTFAEAAIYFDGQRVQTYRCPHT